jgi:hypothetical protein
MQRVWSLVVVLGLSTWAGCPGREEPADDGQAEEAPVATDDDTESGPRKEFPEGVGSGRAEDGSEEDL